MIGRAVKTVQDGGRFEADPAFVTERKETDPKLLAACHRSAADDKDLRRDAPQNAAPDQPADHVFRQPKVDHVATADDAVLLFRQLGEILPHTSAVGSATPDPANKTVCEPNKCRIRHRPGAQTRECEGRGA